MKSRHELFGAAVWFGSLVAVTVGCSGTVANTCTSAGVGGSGADPCGTGGGGTSAATSTLTGGASTIMTGATGGARATTTLAGGTATTGGAPNSGGTDATGGSPVTGGTHASGGSSALGGNTGATGGSPVTGGTRASGGSSAPGGNTGTSSTRAVHVCGDGVGYRVANVTVEAEECDDGNTTSGDGCESDCTWTKNPYPFHQVLQYTGNWSLDDDEFGVSLATDRDWLVIGASPGGGTFNKVKKINIPTIAIYRHDPTLITGPKYVQVAEIRANEWTTWPNSAEPEISISGNLIGWNNIIYSDNAGQDQVGAMVLEWTGSVWQKKFGVPYPSSINKCPISTSNCSTNWPTHAWIDRGRLIVSDNGGDVTVPQGQPGAGSYIGAGRAFIFRVDGTAPVLEASLYDTSTTMFGSDLRMFDDVAAVSSRRGVNLYRRTGTNWQLEQFLPCVGNIELERDLFVTSGSCGISASPVGTVNVFRHVKSGWAHEQTILPITYTPDLDFGQPVSGSRRIAVSSNRIVVGARGYGIDDGAAYVYTRDPNRYPAWQGGMQLLNGDATVRNSSGTLTNIGDEVGWSVATVGRAMIVGAPGSYLLADKYPKMGKVHIYMDCPFSSGCPLDVCAASTAACDGSIATSCDAEGLGHVQGGTDCGVTSQVCSAGTCVAPTCDFGDGRCSGNVAQRCADDQQSWLSVDVCGSNEYCADGKGFWPLGCHTLACTPNSSACVREVAGTCKADGSGLVAGGTDCRAAGGACDAGGCVSPTFYEGFENGLDLTTWTVVNSGTHEPATTAGGAVDTAHALSCVQCQVRHDFATRVQPSYVGFWARTAQVGLNAMSKEGADDVFSVQVDTIDTHQSVTLNYASYNSTALGRWPSVRTTEWSLFEFKNIDWTARRFDFYYNGDLLASGAPLNAGSGLDYIQFKFSNWLDFEQMVDEIVVK